MDEIDDDEIDDDDMLEDRELACDKDDADDTGPTEKIYRRRNLGAGYRKNP